MGIVKKMLIYSSNQFYFFRNNIFISLMEDFLTIAKFSSIILDYLIWN